MKVSIIVPVYKVEKYINACVESIVNQTYKNLEIILVDDGSPDNCPKICDDWANKDERIKVIHKENGGLSDARNVGMRVATGNFISFVDSDDTIHPEMIEILMGLMNKTSCEISMCSWKKVYDINKPYNKKINKKKLKFDIFEKEEVFDLIYNKKVPLIMAAWAKLYKKDIFKDIEYPVGKLHEDEAVIHKILYKCKKLGFVDLKMYNNTQRNDSITASTFNKKRLQILDILKERIDFVTNNCPNFTNKAINHYLRISILYYHYVKWAKLDNDILEKIRQEIDFYADKGYDNKLTKLFYKYPKILSCILKIREKLI